MRDPKSPTRMQQIPHFPKGIDTKPWRLVTPKSCFAPHISKDKIPSYETFITIHVVG